MRRKIVLIDDDPITVAIMAAALAKAGYDVYTARDGETGLSIVERESPDLVVTDLLIPKSDGIAVCRKIRESPASKSTKVIVMSALRNPTMQREAKGCGADLFLEKPVNPQTFLAAIERLIGI
jgi:DNA-binding response OmpR family regulator